MAFQIFSPAFTEGGNIPELHTCQGADLSPALEWKGEPRETRSFVLLMDDPDAPAGTWNHWLLYDIPSAVHNLPQGFKPGNVGLSGKNDFGKPGYGGPCPPKGHGPHRYFFRLYAMGVPSLDLPEGASRKQIDAAGGSHAIAEVQWMGRFERR